MNDKKNKPGSLIFGPFPPPVGGVASIIKMLNTGFKGNQDILFRQPLKKNTINILRPIVNFIKILFCTLKIKKNGSVLLFSSAGFSFYEKLFWAKIIIFIGRKPVLIMIDGNFPIFYESKSKILKKTISNLINDHGLVIGTQSEFWLKYYKGLFPRSTVMVVSASVDDAFQQVKNTQFNKKGDVEAKLLYVGWIISSKGIIDLIDAIVLINQVNKNVKLELVGPLFNKEEYWMSELKNRGISEIVKFTGVINNRSQLIEKLLAADIFVFPSHFEGLPVAMIEAISVGLPCVATNVGGIPDILDNGRVGKLVNSNSPKELSEAIIELIENTDLRKSFSTNSAEWAKEKYSFSNLIESYTKILSIN